MAQTLAFLHTAPMLAPTFAALAAEKLPGVRIFHMVDESLIQNTLAAGKLERDTIRRICNAIESAHEGGADVVMLTCSSVGAAVDVARQLVDFPVLRVDEAMADEAVSRASRIGVAATLRTTLEPTAALIRERARIAGVSPVIVEKLCEGAFEAVRAGDGARHDEIVGRGLRELAGEVDVIVLAQASMARVVDTMPESERTVPILSSPALGVERAKRALEELDRS